MTRVQDITDLCQEANFIDGAWLPASPGETIDVVNPGTGEVIGAVPNSAVGETRLAIAAATKAFKSFARETTKDRAEKLRTLHGLILAHQEELAMLLTVEQGKPIAEAKAEIGMSAAYVLWFAEQARRTNGDVVPSPWADRKLLVINQPVGVVAAITPWNFPSSMLARKLAPALAAGCTVVAKPAIQTPFSGLAWGELARRAGFPDGAINVVTGDAKAIGKEMTDNPDVRKITFTGSTGVGKVLLAQAAGSVKKVSMELGGNAPFIVFDDADLDRAVKGAIDSKFRNTGQTCVCTNRFYAQANIYADFVSRLTNATRELKVGVGTEIGVEQGPLIDAQAQAKVADFVKDAVDKGGKVTVGGRPHPLGGNFYSPTVIADAHQDMLFAREEIFGPIAPVFRFDTEEEVVEMANATQFGLACYFYTQDLARTFRVSEALEYGIVGINEGLVTTEVAPFGGVKESGIGREGSSYGMDDYLEKKYVCIGGLGAVG